MPIEKPIQNPVTSLEYTLAFSSRDWGAEKRDAWIWGIVCGWTDDCFHEFNEKFGWDEDTWARLQRLHKKFVELKGEGNEKTMQQ